MPCAKACSDYLIKIRIKENEIYMKLNCDEETDNPLRKGVMIVLYNRSEVEMKTLLFAETSLRYYCVISTYWRTMGFLNLIYKEFLQTGQLSS